MPVPMKYREAGYALIKRVGRCNMPHRTIDNKALQIPGSYLWVGVLRFVVEAHQ